MKKVLLSMALLASVSANAQEITLNGLKYAVTDVKLKTARVIDEVSSTGATSYDVPATIEIGGARYTVNSIGEEAFKWSSATSITLPETIDSIYNSAFNTAKITSIQLPSKLKYIGDYAFGSSALTSIEIPASVQEVGGSAFFTCKSLVSAKFNEGLTKMGTSVFYGCESLTTATLPESLVEIPAKAFLRCHKLENVKISSKAVSLGDAVFNDCKSLKSITLPATLKTIGDEEFLSCTLLTSINIPAQVEEIGTSLIAQTGVTTITVDAANKYFHMVGNVLYSSDNRLLYAIPQKGVTDVTVNSKCVGINGGAFWGSEIKKVTLPKGFLAIDDYAFCESSLESINFPSSLIFIGEQGFAATQLSGELSLPVNMPDVQDGAFAGCKNITSLVIPSGVKSIYAHAFHNSPKLAKITCLGINAPKFVNVYEEYDSPFYKIAATKVTVPKGAKAYYQMQCWNDYLTIEEADKGSFLYTSTSPANGSYYSSKWAEMKYDVVFNEPITIVQKNPDAYLRVGGEMGGQVLEPDDSWNATTGDNKNTLRVWGADYDLYTMTFSVDPDKTYTMVIPAGVVKNAAGETNERIVINVYGSDPTGVEHVSWKSAASASTQEVARYNLNGQKVGQDHKGLTIVKYADGTAKTVVVK